MYWPCSKEFNLIVEPFSGYEWEFLQSDMPDGTDFPKVSFSTSPILKRTDTIPFSMGISGGLAKCFGGVFRHQVTLEFAVRVCNETVLPKTAKWRVAGTYDLYISCGDFTDNVCDDLGPSLTRIGPAAGSTGAAVKFGNTPYSNSFANAGVTCGLSQDFFKVGAIPSILTNTIATILPGTSQILKVYATCDIGVAVSNSNKAGKFTSLGNFSASLNGSVQLVY